MTQKRIIKSQGDTKIKPELMKGIWMLKLIKDYQKIFWLKIWSKI